MLTADDLQNAINAIEGTSYRGKDAPAVAAMLGRFRQALGAAKKPQILRGPPAPAAEAEPDKTATGG